jgi:hypothetical protein
VRGTILPQRSRWVCASEPAIAQRCFNGSFKRHSDVVRERKTTLKFHSRTPSLLQDSTSLPAFLLPTAESAFNQSERVVTRCRISAPIGGLVGQPKLDFTAVRSFVLFITRARQIDD